MASKAKYAKRRRNAFIATCALAVVLIIIVIIIIVSVSKNTGGSTAPVKTIAPTLAPVGTPVPTPVPGTVTPSPSAGTETPTPTPPAGSKIMYVTGDGVNVREAPSSSAKAISVLAKGTQVTAGAATGSFTEITLSNGTKGFMASQFLSEKAPSTTVTPTPTASNINYTTKMYVTGSSVNVRAAASASSNVVTTLKKGAEVTAGAVSGDFYPVKFTSGGKTYTGYISKSYLATSSSSSTPAPTPAPAAAKTWDEVEGLPHLFWLEDGSGTSAATRSTYLAKTAPNAAVSSQTSPDGTVYTVKDMNGGKYYILVNKNVYAAIYTSFDNMPNSPEA